MADRVKENEKIYEAESKLRRTFDGGEKRLTESVEMMEIRAIMGSPDIGLRKGELGMQEIQESKEVRGSSKKMKPLDREGTPDGVKKSVRWGAGPGGDIQESKVTELGKGTLESPRGKPLDKSLAGTDFRTDTGVKLDAPQIKRVAKEIFNLYDDNDSGYLERAEIKQIWTDLMSELGKGGVPEDQLDQMITKYDTNGDGEFSMAEVKQLLTPIIEQELQMNPRTGHLFFRDIYSKGSAEGKFAH